MTTKRKTDLFRFITLRAPQLISKEKRALGFIEHPNPGASHFLQKLSANDSLTTKRTAIRTVSTFFTSFTKVEEVKALNRAVWEFSLWLSENKNKLDRTTIDAAVPKILLTAEQMLNVWDNVQYDILERKNPYIRQACLQLIVAQNFADHYKTYSPVVPIPKENLETEMAALKRLANGKVVIDSALSAEQAGPSGGIAYIQPSTAKQASVHRAKLAALQTPVLKKMREDLISLSQKHTADYQAGFDEAYAVYQKQMDAVVLDFLAKTPELQNKTEDVEKMQITKKEGTKESTELSEKRNVEQSVSLEYEIPEKLVDDFEFHFAEPLSDAYTQERLSATTRAFVQKNKLQTASVEEAIDALDHTINLTEKAASYSKRKRYKEVLINGIQTRRSENNPNDFALSFHKKPVNGEVVNSETANDDVAKSSDRNEIYLSVNTGYDGAFITGEQFFLETDNTKQNLNDVKVLDSGDQNILIKLDASEGVVLPDYKAFDFQASFKLDNGTRYRIAKKGYTHTQLFTGVAVPVSSDTEEEVHYGVNKIGIADFRKVEQELCCYIAGEVSHIENILAREYKEKSTRHLTSSETTTDSFTERETEEVTDTSSTARHEMSSEIAEVLEKDRSSNLGFSAGTSGEYGKAFHFNADAYGSLSLGQSSSESNSIARAYAEDVTRRALERIVQRVSQRRTSRVLKEFEENNRHGYDNRDGDAHVTGVFRWIDKVYKNRIVNYGKRLVYEFMIPEPARFYKDAIILKAEEEETTTASGGETGAANIAVKPDHPSIHGIHSANDITRAAYQQQAALYGVSPDAPMDEFVSLTQSSAENIGNSNSEKSFRYLGEINVPADYVGCHVIFDVSYKYKARVRPKAYIKVSAAGRSWISSYYKNQGRASKIIPQTISKVTGRIGVVVVTKKMTEFSLSVTVKCCLQQSVLDQWKKEVYEQIMEAYNKQLEAYNDAQNSQPDPTLAASDNKAPESLNLNPKFNAKVVTTELKRLCIEMLTRPFGILQGRDLLRKGACETPEIILGKTLDLYGSQVKFFEQAFDWHLMAQMFYPYYWAKRCDWKDLFQSQASNDHIFQAFLQSGMGRVVVPVRPGFEDAVTYFMETGEIWNGTGIALDTDDELYLSVMDEMTRPKGTAEEEEWETVVPSSLTLVQARSAYLNDEGLPCCETDEELSDQLNIEASTHLLERKADA